MRKFISTALPIILLSLLAFTAGAQQLSGIILDEGQKPLASASVDIRRATDSSVIKYTVSDGQGKYLFNSIAPGNYFLHVTHLGYAVQRSASFTVRGNDGLSIPPLLMNKASGDLATVTVNSHKPVIEVKADRTILNVEGSVNAVGQDVLELLRKSPGVMVDKDNNISLSGKNGVKVYIDGRQVPLNGTDLSD